MQYCYSCCDYTAHGYLSGHVKTDKHMDAIFYDKDLKMEQDSTDTEIHITWKNSEGNLHRSNNRPAHIILYKLKGIKAEGRRNQCEPYTLQRGANFQRNKSGKWFIVRKEFWCNGTPLHWEGAIAPNALSEFTKIFSQTTNGNNV